MLLNAAVNLYACRGVQLSAYVVNAVLSQDTPQDRAEVITFFLAVSNQSRGRYV